MNAQLRAETIAQRVLRTSRQDEVPDTYFIEGCGGHEYYDDDDRWCCKFPDGSALYLRDNVGLVLLRS